MKLKRINFKNLSEPSLSEEILEALQDNIDEAINTKPILKVKINRQTIVTVGTYGDTIVPLNDIEINNDNKQEYFKLNGNSILIGENVSLVKIVAFTRGLAYPGATVGDKEFILRKNEQSIQGFYQRFANDGYGYMGAIATGLFQVNQGDKIDILLSSQTAGNTEILEGYLQIELVKGE